MRACVRACAWGCVSVCACVRVCLWGIMTADALPVVAPVSRWCMTAKHATLVVHVKPSICQLE